MLKVKIKLPAIDMGMLAHNLKNNYQHQDHIFLTELGVNLAFSEMGDAFLSEIIKHRDELSLNPNKKLSKSIPASTAVLFFSIHNGVGGTTEKNICSQIEDQLFKTGYIKIEKGAYNG